ncbi:Ig-like domain-containing protein [uncultured Shewanella sp.]|uniref:Ig-like domain-containing protein n=1 Tax=uncultured Shewanella sp. TaxID=173975 RepID=UPI00262EB122|nr:Ig-like domain-containing protein [uncultured Shewanella sp.]
MNTILKYMAIVSFTLMVINCNNSSDNRNEIVSLIISPESTLISIDETQSYTLQATYNNGNTETITDDAEWSSSDTEIAIINDIGIATGIDNGTVNITATLYGISASAILVVNNSPPKKLVITPQYHTIQQGSTLQYTADLILDNDTVVDVTDDPYIDWSSSHTNYAIISQTGLAQAQDNVKGTTDITAKYNNDETLTANATLTISNVIPVELIVLPEMANIAVGLKQAYTATVIYNDKTTADVTRHMHTLWFSSEEQIANITENGIAEGLSVGQTSIAATFNGLSGSSKLNVSNATVRELIISPLVASIPNGISQQFEVNALLSDGSTYNATNDSDTVWSSDNEHVALMDNVASGQTNTLNTGKSIITAAYKAHSASAELFVTEAIIDSLVISPKVKTVPKGHIVKYKATLSYTDHTTEDVTRLVTWLSEHTQIATIDQYGIADTNPSPTHSETGLTEITAIYDLNENSQLRDIAELYVSEAIPKEILISPRNVHIPVGSTQAYDADIIYTDGSSHNVTHHPATHWVSTKTSVASINSQIGEDKGIATAKTPGETTISVQYQDYPNDEEFEADTQLTVQPAKAMFLVISPKGTQTRAAGETIQYIAELHFDNETIIDVTKNSHTHWHSSNRQSATIENNQRETKGLVITYKKGTTQITAQYYDANNNHLIYAEARELIITPPIPTYLAIEPQHQSKPLGSEAHFHAILTYSDGHKTDVTNEVDWLSLHPDTAIMDPDSPGTALTYGRSPGTAPIIATFDKHLNTRLTAEATLIVTNPTPLHLTLQPDNPVLYVNQTIHFTAKLHYSDGSEENITDDDNTYWVSDKSHIVSISNNEDNKGLATAHKHGTTDITVSYFMPGAEPITTTTSVQVIHDTIEAFVILPKEARIPERTHGKPTTKKFTAYLIYHSGAQIDVSAQTDWYTSNNKASVANGGPVAGTVTAHKNGEVDIKGNYYDQSNSTPYKSEAKLTITR